MFARMRRGVLADHRRRAHQRVGQIARDRHHAGRRFKSGDARDRDAGESDEMRRPDEHGDVEAPAAQQAIRVRGDRT